MLNRMAEFLRFSIYSIRTCYSPKLLQRESKDLLKQKLMIRDNLDNHLEQLGVYDAGEKCKKIHQTNVSRYWSSFFEDLEFNLVPNNSSVSLHYLTLNDVIKEDQYCVTDSRDAFSITKNGKTVITSDVLMARGCM